MHLPEVFGSCCVQAGEKDSKLWVNPIKRLTCLLVKHGAWQEGVVSFFLGSIVVALRRV